MSGTATPPEGNYATDLFFSEYLEGSSNNKALEIFNGTGVPVDLGTYKVYTWVAGSVDNWSDNLVNRWKEVGSVTVSKKRTYKWRGTSDQLNGVADKLLFLK